MKIELDRVWIHNADDLAELVAAFSDQPVESQSRVGEVRQYASGRLQTVVRAGGRRSFDINLVDITDADLELLRDWVGRPVMFRDKRGRLHFGTYFELTPVDHADGTGWQAAFTLHEVTRSVGV